ncbi:uncharacterized protein LOC115426616 isoform X2 [Sphaeramia orbicularis]|uniref:uncharacterized protein LOC115426616 isoform X2 n=1 Tax=Sphaeramia orbicularis TaxID=375764 RepID=UPI001180FA1D|nr:uncharacterized protein LOC115426616 isoform X2 [Sphaeramia orbicularis]
MLFLCLTLSVFPFVLSNTLKEACYGGQYNLPPEYAPPLFHGDLFFTSSNTGVRRLVSNDDGVKDARFVSSFGIGLTIQDLTEQDNGVFSVSYPNSNREVNVITLKVLDCVEPRKVYYGSIFSFMIPFGAERLEFTPSSELDQVTVRWDHTGTKGGRGSVTRHYWEITDTTQKDTGYYKFRGKHNKLLAWRKLLVEENERHVDIDEGRELRLDYHDIAPIWMVTFQPLGTQKNYLLIVRGTANWNPEPFEGRVDFRGTSIAISSVEYQDSGTYEFIDSKGCVALRVTVEVTNVDFPSWVYALSFAGVPFGAICCCYCVKSFRKKSSSKRNNPNPEMTAAPTPATAVHYHDTTQPTGPGQSGTSVPVNLPAWREQRSTSGGLTDSTQHPVPSASAAPNISAFSDLPMNPPTYMEAMSDGPPTYESVNFSPSPPQPEAAAGGSDFISSDSEPKFDVEESASPSAAPLSSDTTCDVYTSDKFNFL